MDGGILKILRLTTEGEGVRALWKGLAPPLCMEGAINMIYFGVFSACARYIKNRDHSILTPWQAFISGSCAGFFGSFVVTPTDLLKVRSQVDTGSGKMLKGPRVVMSEIYRKHGLMGFTRGFSACVWRDTPAVGFYFGFYDMFRGKFGVSPFFSGAMAGLISWIFCYPFDVIKTRIQATEPTEYKGVRDCFRKAVYGADHERFNLWRGLTPCLIRSLPVNGTIFLVYELLVSRITDFMIERRL
eukprot:TRINITY_DN6548_c0_g1_i4.p1 TRINITY_DN6548_c0_g1~~TRINITY_DN6548_c0_g1_i4.p1  ORF type:complete len:243 (-),score=34.82 TRINITY_DN6548_c0_g1_i4:47-775(-)